MKLYDFDGMFDEKLGEYIKKNSQKYKESEWEDIIPKLYKSFGDTFIKSVGDTPNGFYKKMTDAELISALTTHIKKGVPVSEYLCSAIESRNAPSLLIPLLDGEQDLQIYAINLLGANDKVIDKYLDMLVASADSDMKDRLVDMIKEKADLVSERAYKYYCEGVDKEYMLEIMSRSVVKDDKIFNALLKEFRSDADNIPMHASYLAAYGDDRALKYLLDKIDEEGISFIEFQELKFAIESLGGEYTKERDFSDDPYYNIVKSHNVSSDIFDAFNKKDE